MLVLGLETSCDETAAAVVEAAPDGRYRMHSSVVSSQVELHSPYGGVVPEIASRAHLDLLTPVVTRALAEAEVAGRDLDAVAATSGPGLIGALLVGVAAAKGLALVWDRPFVGVNHLEAHLFAPLLTGPAGVAGLDTGPNGLDAGPGGVDDPYGSGLAYPAVVLLVSGGHTLLVEMAGPGRYRLLGQTLDDAAGEAFDKVARLLDLGYPGGPVVDRLAAEGDPRAVAFPRAMERDGLDFSFSGLKTSVVHHVRRRPDLAVADVCASFQAAVVDVLLAKACRAAELTGAASLALAGGVAANAELRRRWMETAHSLGLEAHVPPRSLCTDNAAMVAAAGAWRLGHDGPTPLDAGANPNLALV